MRRLGAHWRGGSGAESSLEGDMCGAIGSPLEVIEWLLEDDTLVVAFAVPLAFDAIHAYRPLLSALDASLATSQAASLGPFARQPGLQFFLSGDSPGTAEPLRVVAVATLRFQVRSHAAFRSCEDHLKVQMSAFDA